MVTHAAGSADPIAVFGGPSPSLNAEQYKCVILKLRDPTTSQFDSTGLGSVLLAVSY